MQHSLMPRAFANSMRHMATSHSLPMIRGLRSEMLAPAENRWGARRAPSHDQCLQAPLHIDLRHSEGDPYNSDLLKAMSPMSSKRIC